MGLDMTLKAQRYISGWESSYASSAQAARDNRKEVEAFEGLLNAFDLDRTDLIAEMPNATVSIDILYWRKANAIHGWFVDNVAGGVDDCRPVRVDRSQLSKLMRDLGEVLGLRHSGSEESGISIEDVLPTRVGSFFGTTDYDEYFWEYVEYTYRALYDITENPKFNDFDFVYEASW